MTKIYCPKCGNKGSLYHDEEQLSTGETKKYWKVGHKGTKHRHYCYLGRTDRIKPEHREFTVIQKKGIEEKTIEDVVKGDV